MRAPAGTGTEAMRMEPQTEVRNEVLETGRKGHLLKWQITWLQGVLAPGLHGETELNNELGRKPKAAVFRLPCGFL